MRKRNSRSLGRPGRESGLALIALVALVAMMAAYYIIGSLNRTSSEVVAERNRSNRDVLQEAKAALIAYAASEAQWSGSVNDQPGSLPCPSTDTSGNAGTTCTTNATRIGRLPWNKIGASQLRDASGELLWYGLSANFRKASGTNVINSDTQGTITVTGTNPATNIVAVIIAPGQALGNQSRTASGVASNTYTDFLEGVTTTGSELTFNTAASSDTFNDQIITVTQAEIMELVEQTAFAHFQQDIKPSIQAYYTEWGRLPYPSSFTGGPGHPGTNTTSVTASNRLQSAYDGSASMTAGRGLLPITNSVTYPWASSGTVAITGGIAGTITAISCAPSGTGWKCSFTINALNLGNPAYLSSNTCLNPANGTRYQYCIVNPAFSVAGSISNVGLSFGHYAPTAAMTAGTDVTVTNTTGTTTRVMATRAMSYAMQTDGSVKFTFAGTHSYSNYSASSFTRTMAVTIPDRAITVRPFTSPTDTTAGWFIKNEWFRQMYYVASPGYLPGAAGSCTPSCLTVSGLSTSNNIAIALLMGRSLNGSSRPSTSLTNYLEGNNATSAVSGGYSYAHTTGASSSTNDRATVIAP